ncbi:MAG TPA: PD-(D/E)XK nuclease family protein [Chthoniobacterales bacterium]|nr:PD-(D/E)XK nuclease family protein [Chthoniobacterales bacterium]
MPKVQGEVKKSSPIVSLHIGASSDAAWESVVRRWFEKIRETALRDAEPSVVVTGSRSQAYFFRNRLLATGKSLIGVKFLLPPQLREQLLLRERGLKLPLREHLRLLLAVTAEQFATEKIDDEQLVLVAKSIARDPDHFLRVLDQLGAAGWSFDEIESSALREIAAHFEKQVRECGFTFVYDADRAAIQLAQKSQPLFSNLLVFGFDAAHWPQWPLLRAAVLASNAATIVLNDPRDEARDLDEAWVGTWEETFGEAEVIPPLPESADIKIGAGLATDNLHFVVGRDTTQQARAIVALAAKFLADPKCERLGILFAGPGALPRLVATFLASAQIAHNDGIAHLAPGAFDDEAWRAWLELQRAPRFKSLLQFLRATEIDLFGELSILQVEDTLRRAYNEVLIDDIELLQDYCANYNNVLRNGQAVAAGLEKVHFLPANESLAEFLSQTRKILAQLGWKEHWSEVDRLSRNWSAQLRTLFSKNTYLRWLRDVLGAPCLRRDDFGAHLYARVHLLPYSEAHGQPWSHLVLAGLNDEAWPSLDDELGFVGEEQIDELNRQNKALNQRASKRGRQGDGHWSAREGKTLLLGANERRQIRRRQLLNLVESVTAGIGASANLYSAAQPGRIANPSEFFSWLYFTARGRGVSQQTLQTLEEQTRAWLKDWSPIDAQRVDSISVGRTRYAFNARRQERPAGEYEFALKSAPEQDVALRVTQWEQALRWPAIVWMEIFLGVEGSDENGDAWPVATGQWVHRWLANSVRDGEENAFLDVSHADEIRARIVEHAQAFRREIEALGAGRGKTLPDWWRSGWSNALYITDCLAAKVSGLHDWSKMAVEWSLGSPALISLGENETLRVRGRIDLILARRKSDQSQLGYDDLWVVDYKTGRQRGFNQRSPRGKETTEQKFHRQLVEGRGIQLALYALAARSLGAKDVELTLLSPAEQLEAQFQLTHVLAQEDFWREMHRMQETGVFGMLGPVHSDFGFVRKYPLATLPIDPDLLKTKWILTHPAFSLDAEEEMK